MIGGQMLTPNLLDFHKLPLIKFATKDGECGVAEQNWVS